VKERKKMIALKRMGAVLVGMVCFLDWLVDAFIVA
jgi:hypothetical protein